MNLYKGGGIMEFKGIWKIGRTKEAGTCTIDENNDITLVIHKSDLQSRSKEDNWKNRQR